MSTHPHSDDKRLLELLERWQSGHFSRADERELQALADSDEFRRETVEGFWHFPDTDHAAYLESIRARMRKRKGGAILLSMPQTVAAVAAVLILVLAVLWLIPGAKEQAPMASEGIQKPLETAPIASNLPPTQATNEAPQSTERSAPHLLGNSGKPRTDIRLEAGPAASAASTEALSAPSTIYTAEGASKPASDKMVETPPPATDDEFAKVVDEQSAPDPGPGNSAPKSRPRQDASTEKDALKKKARAETGDAQPLGGWAIFQDYLRKQARLTEAARQNNVSGSVRLKFRLDEKNHPVNFIVLRSLGYGCDEEAIRLVNAYSWQTGNHPELTVDVPFVR